MATSSSSDEWNQEMQCAAALILKEREENIGYI